ncbi:MAG: methyltransferase domain-containing protein [Acidobacteria bacterium]|nr:methyltransferase domain-containing protein [Acidobacteriota bacterium]
MVYDKVAARYDRAMAPLEKGFLAGWRAETLALLPENAKILEIGAGTGANFRFYPPAECAVASELSLAMLDLARSKTEAVSLIQADAEVLPFAANSFDAAFATLVFCSIPKPENAFAEIRRIVRPGGRVVLLEHVRPDGALGVLFDFFNVFTTALIADRFNRRTASCAAESGLDVLEVRRKMLGVFNLIVCENR